MDRFETYKLMKFSTEKVGPSDVETGAGPGVRCPPPISRLRVEKIEGGLLVAGVVIAANCQVALPAFGCLFILVGLVLTAASYRGPGRDEGPDHYAARIAFTGNSRILGPACIVVGALMLAAGVALCILTRRARRKERRVGFHCPLHGDFYPLSPTLGSKSVKGGMSVSQWALCWRRGDTTQSVTLSGPPQCPHSTLSSTRSSVSSGPGSPCPTPLPFLVTSGSITSSMVPSVGANLSPDQTFGSIRSLSVSREVASFPLSRTPTPPPTESPTSDRLPSPDGMPLEDAHVLNSRVTLPPIEKIIQDPLTCPGVTLVAPAPKGELIEPKISRGPRKSVSIVLPEEDKG